MKATKKLAFAAVSLAVAASLTVGSTLAWFSYQSRVTLGAVDFSVDSSDENLQVAVVAHNETTPVNPVLSDFTYSLKVDTIKSAINGGSAVVYQPLTVKEDADNEVAATNPIALLNRDGASAATAGSYAVFDLVFRYTPSKTSAGVANTNMPSLILDYESAVTATVADDDYTPHNTNYVAWDNFADTVYGKALTKDQPIAARARDTARVAFLFKDDAGAIKNRIWAPAETFGAGITESDTSDRVKGFYNGNLANDYNVHYGHVPVDTVVTAPKYASRVYAATQASSTSALASDFDHFSIAVFPDVQGKTYSELRITVKVWVEGKDGDCISSIQEDKFAFLMKFRTSPIQKI